MSEFHDIAASQEIPPGQMRRYVIDGRTIAVVRTTERLFAVDDSCPHRGGPLSEGDLIACEIVCPWHFWSFDLETGRHTGGSKFAVVTHEIRVENDRVLVRLSTPPEPVWMV